MKKIISFILCSVMIVMSFTGCGRKFVTLDDVDILNYTMPEQGEEIAVITIRDYGDVKIKLFEEQCPKGVENFKKLISEQYYDNVNFHRIIKDFMIQAGNNPDKDTVESFEQEINTGLRHFSGAVSYATGQDKLNGSQFFIVTAPKNIDFYFLSDQGIYVPANVAEMYLEKGGYPSLDENYEVFGQVFEGLDICFAISEAETDENDMPLSDIIIEKAQIEIYKN